MPETNTFECRNCDHRIGRESDRAWGVAECPNCDDLTRHRRVYEEIPAPGGER